MNTTLLTAKKSGCPEISDTFLSAVYLQSNYHQHNLFSHEKCFVIWTFNDFGRGMDGMRRGFRISGDCDSIIRRRCMYMFGRDEVFT